MQITLTNTGKRYNREWIFRHLNYQFMQGRSYAITGANGSGKSTLLQVIAGATLESEGKVEFFIKHGQKNSAIETGQSFNHISLSAPYLELIEEMTATEMLQFHLAFKKLILPIPEILALVGLETAAHKQIRYFSSGMKQRLKLAQAFLSDTEVLLLDEPTTNLDAAGIALYKDLISQYSKGKILIVCSNDPDEYDFCEEIIAIGDYK